MGVQQSAPSHRAGNENNFMRQPSRPGPAGALRTGLTLTLSNIIHSFSCLVFFEAKMKLAANWSVSAVLGSVWQLDRREPPLPRSSPGDAHSQGALGGPGSWTRQGLTGTSVHQRASSTKVSSPPKSEPPRQRPPPLPNRLEISPCSSEGTHEQARLLGIQTCPGWWGSAGEIQILPKSYCSKHRFGG